MGKRHGELLEISLAHPKEVLINIRYEDGEEGRLGWSPSFGKVTILRPLKNARPSETKYSLTFTIGCAPSSASRAYTYYVGGAALERSKNVV
jgi:hypothetical protein